MFVPFAEASLVEGPFAHSLINVGGGGGKIVVYEPNVAQFIRLIRRHSHRIGYINTYVVYPSS